MKRSRALAALALLAAADPSPAQESAELRFEAGLALTGLERAGRTPLHTDPVEASIVAGSWRTPQAGDEVTLPNGQTRSWTEVRASEGGAFRTQGYLAWPLHVEHAGVLILAAKGHSLVYVNGAPRTGDPYGTGTLELPVALRAGDNDLLFLATRGDVQARLRQPRARAFLGAGTATLPHLIANGDRSQWGAIVVVNATDEHAAGLMLQIRLEGGASRIAHVPPLLPLAVHKTPFEVPPTTVEGDAAVLTLALTTSDGTTLDEFTEKLPVHAAGARRTVTFRSRIDGSVQYYALNPAQGPSPDRPAALILSLHGAGVEATGQAAAYADKSWAHLAAATNRRPFGFDWEDWGRKDALEVLTHATSELNVDPSRIYLTGHSMGGHGTWHLGATFPDRFAAIGPSAGWSSFASYGGARRADNPTPMERMLERATNPSDTLLLATNYLQHGVFILHGDADSTVGVDQARRMRDELTRLGVDLRYHEQPGAGHWWDDGDAPGTGCVDFVPMLDFFSRHRRPARDEVLRTAFVTASPGISAWSHWAGIQAQQHCLEPSRIDVQLDPGARRLRGTTDNVRRLAFDLGFLAGDGPLRIELDGDTIAELPFPPQGLVWLERDASWRAIGQPSERDKGPHRYGPFKEAFDHGVVFVYGTRGNEAENAWALAKARFDAETFYYRGNGAIEVVADVAFRGQVARNVILYGNADTNGAWDSLLADSPLQVRRGSLQLGERTFDGDDLACLFLRPRPGTADASVGVVTGTGLPGMRLTDRMPYLVSGVAYPDCTIMRTEVLQKGVGGVVAAGFFGIDWTVDAGDFAFR